MERSSSPMSVDSRVLYEFGPFRLEPNEHRLLREGKPAPVTPKAFDLLVFLVRNQGRLVTKDQIMQAIWPGSFVEEANITVLISALRKILGESEAGDPYIKTVPKKGYRFTASVKVAEQVEPDSISPDQLATDRLQIEKPELYSNGVDAASVSRHEASRPLSRHRILIAVLVFAGAILASYFFYRSSPTPRTLAVLPLQNLRHDPDSDFLGYSLADAVISKLGLLSSVTVRPSSVIQKYKDREIDITKVAGDLNVNTLLTGNFIREGDHLRITYQLIDVPADKILCKDVIDLKYDELLTAHDNVSQQIIKGLQLNLTPSEAERMKPDVPVNALAYEYYLRGVDLMARHNFPLAVKMLEKSAEIDPKYPLTWAYLGQSYTSDATFMLNGRESYRRAQTAYERALALQPKQLEAQMFLANLLIDTGKVEQAVPLLRDAMSRNANDAAVHWELGYAYRFAGMLKESLAECERARQIDPLVSRSNGSVLNTYLYLGRYEDFLRSLPDVSEARSSAFIVDSGSITKASWTRQPRILLALTKRAPLCTQVSGRLLPMPSLKRAQMDCRSYGSTRTKFKGAESAIRRRFTKWPKPMLPWVIRFPACRHCAPVLNPAFSLIRILQEIRFSTSCALCPNSPAC